jgi:hypothetical protein
MSADRPISTEDVAVLLASALGQDKSDEIVMSTARALGIARHGYTGEEVRAMFDQLVTAEGLVGVVARFAVSRGDVDKLIAKAAKGAPPQVGRPEYRIGESSTAPSSPPPRPERVEILHLIAPALGAEKARDAIEQAAARRGVDVSTGLSHNGAIAVLDEMTKVEGIVGVVARFAKARFLLDRDK